MVIQRSGYAVRGSLSHMYAYSLKLCVFTFPTQSASQLAALQLVEKGLLSLDTPVSDFFPEFATCVVVGGSKNGGEPSTTSYQPAKQIITVEHLMHHTSGLFYSSGSTPDWDSDLSNPYSFPQSAKDPVGEFLRWIKVRCQSYPKGYLLYEPHPEFVCIGRLSWDTAQVRAGDKLSVHLRLTHSPYF